MFENDTYDIFISYRRDGGDALAVLLEERLSRLGYSVFLDVESLRSGDFNESLLDSIENCTDFLLVLPENGLDRCINNPKDWVRREIAHALKLEKNVIPVMMRNFNFPENLPEDIKRVEKMNGVAASMDDFTSVINRLVTKFLHSKPYDDKDNIIELLKRKVKNNDSEAMNELALEYESGNSYIPTNTKEAFRLFNEAAELGNLAAIYNIGDIYERCAMNFTLIKDYGINYDPSLTTTSEIKNYFFEESLNYYKKAAELNYAPALFKVGNIYEERKDIQKALDYYKEAATLEFPPAQNALGYFYQNGINVEKDIEKARFWYQKAVNAEFAPAIYNLALLTSDPSLSFDMLRKIAFGENALPLATYALGHLYEFTFHDRRNATECYKLAHEAGIAAAEKDLERCRYTLK